MEKTTLITLGYEVASIFNALFIILWVLLAIFPGVNYLFLGPVVEGLEIIFLNSWFYLFAITLACTLLLQTYKKEKPEQQEEKK